MTLARTSLLNAVAVVTRLATTLVLNKLLAVYVGTAGYGLIGQFQSLVTMVVSFASGGMNTGVTKYTAEFHADPALQRTLWRTAATLSLGGCLAVGLLMLVLQEPIARWTLGGTSHQSMVLWLVACLPLLVFNGLMLAILNGCKAVNAFVAANIAGSLLTAAVAGVLVVLFGLQGALAALVVSPAMACLATSVLFRPHARLSSLLKPARPDGALARKLSAFALMGLVGAVLAPLSMMLIRQGLATRLDWHHVGLWQALWKISETHLMLLTSTLSLYFLPRYSEIREPRALLAEVRKGYRFVLPLVLCTSAALYWSRDMLVHALLTAEFAPLTAVLGWQLTGDVLKAASWVLGFTLISHARTRAFIVTELVFSALLVVLTLAGAALDGLRGAAAGYALTYLVYGATVLVLFRRLLRQLARPAATGPSESSPA